MLHSPYLVHMDDGKFGLCDDFLNTKVGRFDKEGITSSTVPKEKKIYTYTKFTESIVLVIRNLQKN